MKKKKTYGKAEKLSASQSLEKFLNVLELELNELDPQQLKKVLGGNVKNSHSNYIGFSGGFVSSLFTGLIIGCLFGKEASRGGSELPGHPYGESVQGSIEPFETSRPVAQPATIELTPIKHQSENT